MLVVFTDLDGTLLDSRTYDWHSARPAIKALRRRGIPVVFCTSKTRAEVEFWRSQIGNKDPFIVENGGAIYLPEGCFEVSPSRFAWRPKAYDVIEIGTPRLKLLEALQNASLEAGCEVAGFATMNIAEIAARTQLPIEQAALAKLREYDEPFEVVGKADPDRLLSIIEESGNAWTHGGRFYHITGGHDKGTAVRCLSMLYRKAFGVVVTAGLGDAPNDVGWLNAVDLPIVVRSAYAAELIGALPHGRLTSSWGPRGWNEAVLQLIAA